MSTEIGTIPLIQKQTDEGAYRELVKIVNAAAPESFLADSMSRSKLSDPFEVVIDFVQCDGLPLSRNGRHKCGAYWHALYVDIEQILDSRGFVLRVIYQVT